MHTELWPERRSHGKPKGQAGLGVEITPVGFYIASLRGPCDSSVSASILPESRGPKYNRSTAMHLPLLVGVQA